MADWPNVLTAVKAAALQASFSTYQVCTMATANITQAAPAAAPTWARYVMAWGDQNFRINHGAPTTATTGAHLPANQPMMFPLGPSTGDLTIYCESAVTLSLAHLTYLMDL